LCHWFKRQTQNISTLSQKKMFIYIYIYITSEILYSMTLCCLKRINPLNTELHPVCYLLALLGAHHLLHVSRIRVNNNSGESFMSVYKTVNKGSRILKKGSTHLKAARCHNPEVRNIKLGLQEHNRNSLFRSRFCEFYSGVV
jgi:hypothetical protein